MSQLAIRFDFRAPGLDGDARADMYATALDMCEWADNLGFDVIGLAEHHGVADGYLPSPMVMAGAIAARTRSAQISIRALVAPLHDPVRVAEDLAVVDIISRGRIDVVLVGGYVASEFEMFGKRLSDRVAGVEEMAVFLRQAWTGEPFEFRGRAVQVTPRPVQRPGPPIFIGGSNKSSARRAARLGDGFMPTLPEFWDNYRVAMVDEGKPDPGPMPPLPVTFIHLTHDVERAWEQIGPHLLHEMNSYGEWSAEADTTTGYQPMTDVGVLRSTGFYLVLTPEECLELARSMGPEGTLMFHPLCGGIPADVAWESLHLLEHEVLPTLRPS